MQYFFDLDGTLLNHDRAQDSAVRLLASSKFDFRTDALEVLPERWRVAEKHHFTRFERGEIEFQEHRRERLRDVFPDFCTSLRNPELDALYAVYIEAYGQDWQLYPDALPVLEALTGRPTALITNGDSALQRSKVGRLGIERYFSSVVVSGEVGVHKPGALPFQRACEQAGVAPQEVTYVGDNFANDVIGSHQAGMNAVWLNRHALPRPPADFRFEEISSLSELDLGR